MVETHPETERVQTEVFRRMSPARRFSLMRSLSKTVLTLSLRRARPGASEHELVLEFVELNYGSDLAERVRKHLEARAR